MADWNQRAVNTPMARVEQNHHGSLTNNFGAMFAGASHFSINGFPVFNVHQAIYGGGSFQEGSAAVPPGYIPDMTDLGPATSFFTGRQDVLLDLEKYFILESASTVTHERKIFLLYGMGGAGKTQTALKFMNRFKTR
ncbi:hypothetical protein GYMLUDRAFT_45666 [Collybiopsis luxurians FD-317 M1]|uniref:Uncharacterized protein n=1 Tax=Collybiopsis luxurians FD-317 M1 TaxID=944289 RepID=A0A0D0C6I1_9AGAR|nr:hypothetical protein GYMLUDRAFT_45666 [Collybiopsis luxurians FD-317 M1]